MFKYLNRKKSEAGSVLIFSVLMLGVILTISLALGNILLPRLRTAGESVNSVTAIYAADSAAEWCLYTHRENSPSITQPTISIGATYTIIYSGNPGTCAPSEEPLNHLFVGTFRGVTRAVEISQ